MGFMRNHIKVYTIETQRFKADGGAMFGVVPKAMWQRVYPADEQNLCPCACRSLLIDTGKKKILIDTGIGNKLDADYAKFHYLFGKDELVKSINNAGFSVDEITDVVLTHLHFDHCGGLSDLDENGKPQIVFKHANIWVSKTQWDWASQPNRREKPAYLKENLEPIATSGKLKLVEDNFKLCPEIEFRLFYGHTKGLMAVYTDLGDKRLVFAGDLLPAIPYIRLSFTAAYDILPLVTIQEKEAFLEELESNGDLLFLQHDNNTEVCSLTKTPKGIRENEKFALSEIQ